MTVLSQSAHDLPLYAAPGRAEVRIAPAHRWPDDWLSRRSIVVRSHPRLEQIEAQLWALRSKLLQWNAAVTPLNAPVTLRVAVPMDELARRWATGRRHVTIAGVDVEFLEATEAASGPTGCPATLRLRWARDIPVTLMARPWSAWRSELELRPRGRPRHRYPRRWFDAALNVLAEIRRELTAPTG